MEATGAASKSNAYKQRSALLRPSNWLFSVFLFALVNVIRTQESLRQLVKNHQGTREAAFVPNTANVSDEGWQSIHVFYGSTKHTPISNAGAELKQDEIVLGLLNNKTNGFFLDLAAHHATFYSNTYRLERTGVDWGGICIEANPAYWRSLSYRKCTVVGAAIGQNRMEEVKFAIGDIGGWEGIVKEGFDNDVNNKEPQRKNNKLHDYFTVPIKEVLTRFGAPRQIDYMSLDVEGAESYIMSNFPFDEYQISILTVERPKPDLADLLKANNYTQTCLLSTRTGETLWTHNSVVDLVNFQSLPPHCLTEGKERKAI